MHIRKVQTIQEEVVRRPVVKQVTREVIREIPKSRKVLREVAVDQMVEVPKIIEIPLVKFSLRTSRSLRSLGTSRTCVPSRQPRDLVQAEGAPAPQEEDWPVCL